MSETNSEYYTTQLQAGLGMIEETRILLDLWDPGMHVSALHRAALGSGRFPGMSARRLRNLVAECFAPRYLVDGARPAMQLKTLLPVLRPREFEKLLFLHSCRANLILADFVREIYWPLYSAGREAISTLQAQEFVRRASQDGRTSTPWAESSVRRVGSYLTGISADFGLLENQRKRERKILPFRIDPRVVVVLAYDLQFAGLGDNRVIAHGDWQLFGLSREDVVEQLKQLAPRGFFIVQTAGETTRISWALKDMEELRDALAER